MEHLLPPNLGLDANFTLPTLGQRTFKAGPYYGFAIGPNSLHDRVRLKMGGAPDIEITPGQPFIANTPGPVRVEAVRYLRGDWGAHVVAFTCPEEAMAGALLKRAPYRATVSDSDTAGDATSELVIPWAGRRHGRFVLTPNGAGKSFEVFGRVYIDTYDQDTYREVQLDASVALVADEAYGHNVGEPATRPEYWDELVIVFTGVLVTEGVQVLIEAFD